MDSVPYRTKKTVRMYTPIQVEKKWSLSQKTKLHYGRILYLIGDRNQYDNKKKTKIQFKFMVFIEKSVTVVHRNVNVKQMKQV